MRIAIVVAILASSCATTTPSEKIESGTERLAFGGPLTILGATGALGEIAFADIAITAPSGAGKDQLVFSAIGAGIGVAAELSLGVFLVATGGGLLEDGLDSRDRVIAKLLDARVRKETAPEDAPPRSSEKPQPQSKVWTNDEDQ